MAKRLSVDVEDQVVAEYVGGVSGKKVAAKYGVSNGSVYNILERRGVERRSAGQPFRDGRSMRDGYVLVNVAHADDVAKAMANGLCQGRYVLEHRLVMARHLGRAIAPNETVHHINGNRADNRIENLQLRIGQHGKHAAFVCADCGSANVVPTKLL